MSIEPMSGQRSFWNDWNAETREKLVEDVSLRHRDVVLGWLRALGRDDLKIIDVGCGAGWLCEHLLAFGEVTGTDLADEVLARAQERLPQATFVAGDFMSLEFPEEAFDVVVSLEVLAHVADHAAFVAKLARLLKPGGKLMLVSQNRPILELNEIPPPAEGQLRRWFDRKELRALLAPHFEIEAMFTVAPRLRQRRGAQRLFMSYKVRKLGNALFGDAYERLLERFGWGWSIMCLAQRKA